MVVLALLGLYLCHRLFELELQRYFGRPNCRWFEKVPQED
jgi:hypothetical protein